MKGEERMKSGRVLASFIGCFLFGVMMMTSLAWAGGGFTYPPARSDDVVDNFFGTTVRDPYRWLEDADSPETAAFVAAQNKLFYDFVETYPDREKVRERLTKLWNYPKYSLPRKEGGRYYFWKNDGLQNQGVLYRQPSLDAKPELVLDPNQWSQDGTVAVAGEHYSHDGSLLAYGVTRSGSDWEEIKVRNVDTGKDYDEVLKFCRFAGAAWRHDNAGFYYNRFPDPATVAEEDRNNFSRIYYHQLGTPQSQDVLIYERPDQKEWGFYPFVTDDGKYLGIHVYLGTDPKNRLYYREVDGKGDFVKLLDDFDAAYQLLDNVGETFYFKTDLAAPRGRVIAINIKQPARDKWREIIPQQDDVIGAAGVMGNQLVISYMHDAYTKVKLFSLEGKPAGELKFPDLGSVEDFSGRREDNEMFLRFESFLYPPTSYRYDFTTKKLAVFRRSEISFDPSGYESRQVFFKSKDGTRVPMFVMHKKGLKQDGSNPALLYGYGGFGVNLTPYFSVARIVWLEAGGVFAVATIRGGGEYGEDWHQAGMLDKKQNGFDDFIAAGEWLIANKYTSSARLAINGGSNGGLLTAACLVQRPDLYGAVVSDVPVIDMLRFQKFTVGRYWVPEYGDAEASAEQFKYLYAYSPLHNVKPGTAYPPTMVTTADSDDRVAPGHAKKFIATLQHADAGANPILLRVETKAGHGHGKPTAKIIEEFTDMYSFLFKVFGIGMPGEGPQPQ